MSAGNLFECGADLVADSSTVDSVNFGMQYELTSDGGAVKVMSDRRGGCRECLPPPPAVATADGCVQAAGHSAGSPRRTATREIPPR